MNTSAALCSAMVSRTLLAVVAVAASLGRAEQPKEVYGASKGNGDATVFSQSITVSTIPDTAFYNFESFDQRWVYETGFARSLGLYQAGAAQLKSGCSLVSRAVDGSNGIPALRFEASIKDPALAKLAFTKAKQLTADQLTTEMSAARQSRDIVSVQVPPSNLVTVMSPVKVSPDTPVISHKRSTPATPATKISSPGSSSHRSWLSEHWLYIVLVALGVAVVVGVVSLTISKGPLSLQAYFYRIGGAGNQSKRDAAAENQKLLDSVHSFEQHSVIYSES